MSQYQRPAAAVDTKIEEIPEGSYRVKIIGTVVNVTPTSMGINDKTGQITLTAGNVPLEGLEVGTFGRFIADVTRSNDKLSGNLITWNAMSPEIREKYWKLVRIERRTPWP